MKIYFPGLNVKDLKRPSGEVDILIGENRCGLHPTDWIVNGDLKINVRFRLCNDWCSS